MTIYSIGHSNRPLDATLALLARHEIRRVVDVRMFPGSRRCPEYGRDRLSASLHEAGIAYVHLPALGGRRRATGATGNEAWDEPSFRAFADYLLTAEGRAGLDELEGLAEDGPTAYLCAEAVWWRCHRRIITDWLLRDGLDVRHILEDGARPATPTPFSRSDGDGVTYPVLL